jgi:hypothetical protein
VTSAFVELPEKVGMIEQVEKGLSMYSEARLNLSDIKMK